MTLSKLKRYVKIAKNAKGLEFFFVICPKKILMAKEHLLLPECSIRNHPKNISHKYTREVVVILILSLEKQQYAFSF